jgi:hypothetical protein
MVFKDRVIASSLLYSHGKQPDVMVPLSKDNRILSMSRSRNMVPLLKDTQVTLADEDGASLRQWSRQAPAGLSTAKKVFFTQPTTGADQADFARVRNPAFSQNRIHVRECQSSCSWRTMGKFTIQEGGLATAGTGISARSRRRYLVPVHPFLHQRGTLSNNQPSGLLQPKE